MEASALGGRRRVAAARAVACAVAWALVAGAGVAAAQPAAVSREPVTLRVAFSRIEGDDIALVRRQAERFAAARPGVRVEIVAQRWRATGVHDLWARYLSHGDASIDVYVVDDPWVAEFAYAGWIRPLDELRAWADAELHPAGLRSAIWRDRLYAVPMELSANALFYRRDLLAKAGLEPPRTLEELFAQARRLRAAHELTYGLLAHVQFAHNDIYPLLWASGGGPLRGGDVALDQPANVRVLEALAAEVAAGGALADAATLRHWTGRAAGYHDAIEAFEAGNAVFMINWLRYQVRNLAPAQVGVAPLPGLAGASPGTGATLGSWFWAVNSASREPALAGELSRSLTSAEATTERFAQLGIYPPLRAFYDDPARADVAALLAGAQPRLPVPNEREVDEVIEKALHEVLIDGRPAAETLARAGAAADALVRALPPEPFRLPDEVSDAHAHGRGRGRIVVIAAAAVWIVAFGLLIAGAIAARRRGGLFRRLATKLSVLGLATILLALTTGTAVALVVLVQNQEEAISQVQDTFRASIRDHSQSLARQLALGASVVREVSSSAAEKLTEAEHVKHIEHTYVDSLAVLAAEGSYNQEILFLQLIGEDGRIVATETDFLVADGGAPGARQVDDPAVRDVARFGRRMSMRDVPATAARPAYLEVMTPLVQHGRHAGAVRIAYSKQRQDERIAAVRARQEQLLGSAVVLVIVAAGGLIGLSAVLLLLFSRSVAQPLVQLSKLAERVGAGDLTVHCEVGGRDEVAALGVRLNQMVVGLREREQIRETLGRYVGPTVSDAILGGHVELGGEERVVTVLFSDVRGFTTMSETMTPPEVVHVLNAYFEQMVESVFSHEGMLDKFIGDGLMAVFGAPRDVGDHAMWAVRCALDMRARLIKVNEALGAEGEPALSIGIGLHTGPVVVGNIGSTKRTEYTAIGDTVNLAARLEGQTKEHGVDILISEATYTAIADRIECDRLGEVRVKGKQLGVVVYAVRGVRGERGERGAS